MLYPVLLLNYTLPLNFSRQFIYAYFRKVGIGTRLNNRLDKTEDL